MVLGVVGGVISSQLPHPESDDPTSHTKRAAWVLSPLGEDGPTVRFEIDQPADWTRVTDSRSAGRVLFAHAGRVYLGVDLAPLGMPDRHYLSIPTEALFPMAIDLSPAQIAPSLDRRPKDCTFPSDTEDAYVRFFFGKEDLDLTTPYAICGSASYSDRAGTIKADEQYRSDAVAHPAADEVVRIEDLGAAGTYMLESLRAGIQG